jgi:acyl carrier protein phosphodiesterase
MTSPGTECAALQVEYDRPLKQIASHVAPGPPRPQTDPFLQRFERQLRRNDERQAAEVQAIAEVLKALSQRSEREKALSAENEKLKSQIESLEAESGKTSRAVLDSLDAANSAIICMTELMEPEPD